MYEKYGLMVKVTNADVIAYLRSNPDRTNRSLIECALCDMLCIPPRPEVRRKKGKRKPIPENTNSMPVKIADPELVQYICKQKSKYGICQRHTVETAVLRYIERQQRDAQ